MGLVRLGPSGNSSQFWGDTLKPQSWRGIRTSSVSRNIHQNQEGYLTKRLRCAVAYNQRPLGTRQSGPDNASNTAKGPSLRFDIDEVLVPEQARPGPRWDRAAWQQTVVGANYDLLGFYDKVVPEPAMEQLSESRQYCLISRRVLRSFDLPA
jgi:hypothetical protein